VAGTLKSKRQETFVEQCLTGRAVVSDIDDFVDQWHSGHGAGSLRTYLGFNEEEYALWVELPRSLSIILLARTRSLELSEAAKLCEKPTNGTRSASSSIAREILSWLKKANRVKSR